MGREVQDFGSATSRLTSAATACMDIQAAILSGRCGGIEIRESKDNAETERTLRRAEFVGESVSAPLKPGA